MVLYCDEVAGPDDGALPFCCSSFVFGTACVCVLWRRVSGPTAIFHFVRRATVRSRKLPRFQVLPSREHFGVWGVCHHLRSECSSCADVCPVCVCGRLKWCVCGRFRFWPLALSSQSLLNEETSFLFLFFFVRSCFLFCCLAFFFAAVHAPPLRVFVVGTAAKCLSRGQKCTQRRCLSARRR